MLLFAIFERLSQSLNAHSYIACTAHTFSHQVIVFTIVASYHSFCLSSYAFEWFEVMPTNDHCWLNGKHIGYSRERMCREREREHNMCVCEDGMDSGHKLQFGQSFMMMIGDFRNVKNHWPFMKPTICRFTPVSFALSSHFWLRFLSSSYSHHSRIICQHSVCERDRG